MFRFYIKIVFFVTLLVLVQDTSSFVRIRLPRIRLPRIRIPRIRIPPIRKVIRTIGSTFEKGAKSIVSLAKGCCGLHPQICRNEQEFKNRQHDIQTKSALMNKDWNVIVKKLNNIKAANGDNAEIYKKIRTITLRSQSTIEILDPLIIERLNNVSNELKKAVFHKNQTVLNYGIEDIDKEFDKEKKETQTSLLDASGIGGFQTTGGYLKMTADMFRMMKLEKVATFMESDVGGFLNEAKLQVSKLFGFHYLEQLGRQNKILGGVLKAFSFYNNYLSLHGSVLKIMEGFNKLVGWINDLATCKSRGTKIADVLARLKSDHEKIRADYMTMITFKVEVDNNWRTVREQIQSKGLLNSLEIVEDIARQSSSQSAISIIAVAEIEYFKRHIGNANEENTIKIQKRLLNALKDITFTIECYERKLATYEAIHQQCKRGQASFEDLYERAKVDFKADSLDCKDNTGLPYTTKEDVLKYVTKKSRKEKFEINCLLNSGVKRALSCEEYRNGYNQNQLMSRLGIDYTTVSQYIRTCSVPEVTPLAQKEICMLKKDNVDINKLYTTFDKFDKAKIQYIYYQC